MAAGLSPRSGATHAGSTSRHTSIRLGGIDRGPGRFSKASQTHSPRCSLARHGLRGKPPSLMTNRPVCETLEGR